MKKVVYLLFFIALTVSVSSCSSRKKGCGLTAENQTVAIQSTDSNTVTAQ